MNINTGRRCSIKTPFTPLKQIQIGSKACKSYDLQAFLFLVLFNLSIKS